MDTIDNLIVALTANIEFKNAIKQLKEFQKKNGDYKLNVNTDDLEKSYENFIKFANKKSVQAFNFSKDTASIIKMSGYEPSGNKAEDNKFYDALFSDLEKTNARMERADKFVKDMVEALGKSEEQILGMISRMSPTDINKLAGNKYSEYDTWSNKRDRAKFKRGYNYSEKAEERADRVAIKREDQGTRAFKNAYVGKDFTEAEQKGIDSIIGKVDDKDLQKILKDYLELETILKRVETEKDKLSQIDNKDEATLKQILQLTADASRLRMLMGQDIIKSNGAMQKFAESNKELKLVDPEIETSENRKKKMQEARKPLILFYQQELEREAQDATDSIIKMFKEAFEKAKASISESADTFSSLGNIDKSVRKYIQNINTTKDAEEKLLEVSEKLKGSKGIVSSENIEYAKDGIGYLRRYVELGGDINKLYDRISPSMKQFFENFSNGQVAPEFMSEFQKIYEEVGKAKDLKIGFGVGSGEGVGNVGQVNDELERQTQIVEKLGEEYKNVAKYAVGAEEALAKVEELAKRSNSKKGIDDLERKDMIGYAARFNAINTDDNLTFSEVAQKAIEENQKKYYATADKVAEMSKKLSSSASGTGNGVGGITPEQLKTLTGYLQQIIDKLKEIKDLSNNKTPLFNDGDIKTFTQGMQEAIDKLDFSKVSESIEKINFKAISEEAEKAIITIAEKFETLGEQIAQSIANGINNGAKEVKVEDTVVPEKEEIKEEKPKTETKPERKAITVEDLDKEIERYSELKTKIDEYDVELEKIKSKRKEPTISPEDIEGIETYLHKLAQVNDSKSSMYDTSSDDNFNFISKDNSDELSKLEISLDNLIQKCEPLKNFTFDFEQFASAEEASAALTTALEQELSVLKQEDPELERQITALSNSRTIMSSQLSNSVSSITNMKKELGVDTTVLDLDEAVNKLNTLDREIVDCEEKIRSLKETEKVNLVSDQDIQQMKQLNEVFRGIKYNPRSFDVTESWQEFDTMLSKSNINEEIKTKLSNTAREIAQTSSMTGNPVSIQKQILDMLQREITEQESLVSANKDKVTVENEEVVVAQNRLTQLQQEKSELQETVNLMKEKLQLQSAATSQPSNQIPVSSGNTASSNPSISDELKIENEQLGENVSKYQEIVSLVQEYYGLIQKLQKPTIEFQKYNEEYARVDQYLRNQMAGKPIDPSDPDTRRKIIHNRYKGFTKGINNGDDFALKAIKSAIYDYWGNATEMPNDEDLLSSTSITEGRGKNSRYTTVIPKKYKELEKSVIQEAIAMNENNKAYKEEREQIEANNSAIKERLNLIRQNIKGIGISPEYKGDYRMGLTLKPSEASKTDIFNMTSSMSQEEMIKEICNMLGIEIPKNAEKAETEIDTFNQKLQESKKYVNEIRQGFMNIVGNVSKKETLEKFPELAEFKNRRSIDEARNFLDTDEWNDFLSTLPQAHTYLESIGYDFERIYKLSDEEIKWFKGLSGEELLSSGWLTDKNGNPLKENYQEIRRAFKASQTNTSSPAIADGNKSNISSENVNAENELKLLQEKKKILSSLKEEYDEEEISEMTQIKSYQEILELVTKIRDLKSDMTATKGKMSGARQINDSNLAKQYEDEASSIRKEISSLEDAIPLLIAFEDLTKQTLTGFKTDDELNKFALELYQCLVNLRGELGLINTEDFSKITSEINSLKDSVIKIPEKKKIEIELEYKPMTPNGELAYRGIAGKDGNYLNVSNDDGAVWWTSQKDLSQTRYTRNGTGSEFSGNLKAKNLFEFTSASTNWQKATYLGDGIDELSVKITDLYNKIEVLKSRKEELIKTSQIESQEYKDVAIELGSLEAQYEAISNSKSNMYGTHMPNDWVRIAKQNGYDGLAIHGIDDDTGNIATSYAVWAKEQIENVKLVAESEEEFIKIHNEFLESTSTTPPTSNSPIKDVFQGNKNGILSDSTTSSSPSKLGVTKNAPIVETDNSQEITREQQALTSLGEYIGQVIKLVNEKTAAFEKEQQVVDGSIQREITALTELSGWLVSVKEDVDKITTAIANLPSIDIKADLSGLDSDKLTEDVVKKFSELSKALNNTDTSNISAEGISALNGLNVSKTAGDNLQKVANAITNIKASLNNLGDGGKAFVEDIKEIVNAGEALKNFNEILKKTKTERKEAAKQATGQSEDKPKTKTQQSNELYGAISVKQKENIKQMRNLLSNTPGVAEEAQRIIDANNVEIKQLEEKIKQQNLFNEKKEAELQVNRDNIAIQELNIQDQKAQNSDKESWIAVNSIKLKDVNLNEVEKLGDDWKIALQQTAEYKDVLGECYDITKQIRRDSKGNYLESYRLTGEKGSVVLGRDGTYLHSNMKVSSAYSDKKQSEKDAEIYNANTSKREENQRKAEVESASNIQKSVWESILQIRTQISDLELKDDQLNDNKIESLKQEEFLLQSIYNDQTRILKAKATQKELESQNTALSKLGIKGKNAEEKVIENAIANKAKEEKMLNDAYAMNADYDKKKAASSTKDNRKEIIAQYNKLISLEKELTTLRTRQQAGIGSQYDIDKIEQEIARRKEIIKNLKQTTSYTQKETDAQTEYNNKVKELQELFNTNSKALGNSQVTDFIKRLGNINVLGLEQNIQDTYTQIGKLTDKFSEGKITVTDYQKQVGNLVIALENVKKVIEPNNINLGKSELEQYFAENGAQVKKVSTSKDGKTLTVDATKYDGVNKSLKELVGTYDLVTGRVSVFERKTSSAMTNLQKSLAAFKGKLQAVFRYLTTFVGVYEIIGAIKSGISTVIEFNTALSEMRKVSSASTATLKELQKESFNVADEVGSTALQIQKSTADFLRLGKSQQKLWLAPLYRNV